MKKRELIICTVVALATTSAWAGTLDLNGPWGMEGATDAYSPALTQASGALEWSFDGSVGSKDNTTAFVLNYDFGVGGADLSGYTGLKFDIRVESNGGSDRNYVRLETRMYESTPEIWGDPDNIWNDTTAQRTWSAQKLDVGLNSAALDPASGTTTTHNWGAGVGDYSYANPPYWPQPEHDAEHTGWSTFELGFDQVTDMRGGFYLSSNEYDVGNGFEYGVDAKGETRNPGYDGIIDRDGIANLGFYLNLYNERWIGDNEQMTIFIDNVQLVPEPATMCLLALGSLALIRRKRRA